VESGLTESIELPAGVQTDSLEADLADSNIEPRNGCGWWFNAGEMVDEDGEVVGYQDCQC
jgi:hypothetical protein